MKCQNCGTENAATSKFCIACGHPLYQNRIEGTNLQINNNVQPILATDELFKEAEIKNNVTIEQQNVMNKNELVNNVSKPNNNFAYIDYMRGILIKPYDKFKEVDESLANITIASILTIIAGVLMMIGGFVNAVLSAIFVRTLDYHAFKYKTSIDFEGLKDLNFVDLIFKNLLIFIIIIVAIAIVYFVISMIFKKKIKFSKLLSISATATLPYAIFGSIIGSILSIIWSPLSVILMVASIVYSISILIALVNEEEKFNEMDFKIYFHAIALSILSIVGYYVIINIMMSGMKDILSLFS